MATEEKCCPICKIIFDIRVGQNQETCGKKCGYKLASSKKIGSTWKWSKNSLKEKKIQKRNEHLKQVEKHRQTIFVGGYDDGDFVTANEGELL